MASCCWFAHIKSECNASVTQVLQLGKFLPKISRWTLFKIAPCSGDGANTCVFFQLSYNGWSDSINSMLLIVLFQGVRQSRWRWMRKVSPPNRMCIGKRTSPTTKTSRKHSQGVSFASIWNSHFRRDSVLIDRLVCQSLR